MWDFRNKVAVAGVGYSPLLRKSRRTLASLAVEAMDNALADAGVSRSQVDGLATHPDQPRYGGAQGGADGIDLVSTRMAARLLGIDGNVRWHLNIGHVSFAMMEAVNALATGACTYALVWRAVHRPEGRFNDFQQQYAGGLNQFIAPHGFTMPAAWAGVAMNRYMAITGCTRESFARLIVQNRQNTNRNPRAYFYSTPLTIEEYLGGRVVADPCTIFDCDLPIDGCAAVLLTTTERARDLRNPPAVITAQVIGRRRELPGTMSMMMVESMVDGAADVAKQLWETSGLGPSDIDAAQLYDGFSVMVYTWLEGLGFCPPGEGWRFVDDGRASMTGELPVNTGGASLGEGRLHGMAHITEAVLQVTGRAGGTQVPGAVHSLATISTGATDASGSDAIIFSRDDR